MDYLVRCKEWLQNVPLVPTMTSNTTPSGLCLASSSYSAEYDIYKAFDKIDSTSSRWVSSENDNVGAYLGYQFTSPVLISKIYYSSYPLGSNHVIKTFKVQAHTANDWVDVSPIFTVTNQSDYYELTNPILSNSYRIICVTVNSGAININVNELQFYSTSILDSERAMYFIGQNNYASDTLLADTDWLEAICDSQYMEYILNTKVPVMTSNTTPYGEASASSTESSSTLAYKAFDNNSSTYWAASTATDQNVCYKFSNPVSVKFIDFIANYSEEARVKNFKIQASNDNSTWVDLYTGLYPNTSNYKYLSVVINNSKYLYYRIYVIDNYNSSHFIRINELQFYGRTDIPDPSPEPSGYKALVPVMTSNTTPSGVASSSGGSYNNTAYKAFDADNVTYGVALAGNTTDQGNWLMYKFTKPVCVKEFILTDKIGTHTMNTVAMQLQGSNDGSNFYEVYSNSSYMASDDFDTKVSINNDNYYLYYRVYYSGGVQIVSGQYFSYILKLQLYGYEDTNTQYLYNNGTWSVGIENPGNNFNRSGTTYSQGATLASNKFTLPSVSSVGSLIGLQKVDLTNINLVQVKCKGLNSTTSYYCILRISDGYNLDSSTVKYANITSNQEHTVPIDVSELTGYYYITLSCNINMSCEVYEIYLQK